MYIFSKSLFNRLSVLKLFCRTGPQKSTFEDYQSRFIQTRHAPRHPTNSVKAMNSLAFSFLNPPYDSWRKGGSTLYANSHMTVPIINCHHRTDCRKNLPLIMWQASYSSRSRISSTRYGHESPTGGWTLGWGGEGWFMSISPMPLITLNTQQGSHRSQTPQVATLGRTTVLPPGEVL